MSQALAHQLGLKIRKTNVGAQKIDGITLETYEIVVSTFSMLNKDGRERFFEENFLLAAIKPDIVIEMFFLTMSKANIYFQAQDLQWKSYTTRDIFSTTKQVGLIGKKKFIEVALNPKHEVFIVHVVALSVDSGNEIYPSRRTQIAHLKVDEVSSEVPSKYTDFAYVFLPKLVIELLEYTEINNHTIELVDDWQLSYGLVYSLRLMELETLKAYIKNNLANSFIKSSKSPVRASIFFDKKQDGSLRFFVDYWDLNNLTIKN